MTVVYNLSTDGQAKKAIGTLYNTLSKMVGSNQKEWNLLIPYTLWAYRTAVHTTTKETPFFMVYSKEVALKYTGPYKITNIVDRLAVDITHLNNLNDQHRVSVRQLKKAFLKPEQLGTLEETLSKDSEKKNTTKAKP